MAQSLFPGGWRLCQWCVRQCTCQHVAAVPAWLAIGSFSTLCSARSEIHRLFVASASLVPPAKALCPGCSGPELVHRPRGSHFCHLSKQWQRVSVRLQCVLPACLACMPARWPASPLTSPFVFCPLPSLTSRVFLLLSAVWFLRIFATLYPGLAVITLLTRSSKWMQDGCCRLALRSAADLACLPAPWPQAAWLLLTPACFPAARCRRDVSAH